MQLFRVARTVPEIFDRLVDAATAKAEVKWFDTR